MRWSTALSNWLVVEMPGLLYFQRLLHGSRLFEHQCLHSFVTGKVAEIAVLPHSLPDEVASDAFVDTLKRATGIWFGGGRQWRFLDAYEGTDAVELFRDVLRRGGVIGGSSAGATIQGEYLVRGHPLGNTIMMAEGYERGFSFLPGVAIDQHFSQRNRLSDLIPVIRAHPQVCGNRCRRIHRAGSSER